jgi:hypothetical protein
VVALGDVRGPTSEEHQREQPARLRFHSGEGELAGDPDRLAGQVHPARVADASDYAR